MAGEKLEGWKAQQLGIFPNNLDKPVFCELVPNGYFIQDII